MFCPYCGNPTVDGATFCPTCGKPVTPTTQPTQATATVDFQAQKNATRQSEIKSLANTIAYFSQKRNVFDSYDNVCDLVNYYARGAKGSLLVWGCIILTFGLILLAGAASDSEALMPLLFAGVIPGVIMIVGGIFMKVGNRKNYEYFQNEYARLSKELYDHYRNYPDCPVGPEYANPEILSVFMGYLQSGRADTIKESINLAVSDAKMRDMHEYLSQIKKNTAAINANTQVAAFFAAANFFK